MHALEAVLIDHGGNCFLPFFVQGANHTPRTVDQNSGIRHQDHGRQHNAETNNGADFEGGLGVEEDASGRDVRGFGDVFARIIGTNGKWKLQRKSNRAACLFHPIAPLSSVYSIVPEAAKDYFGLFAAPKDMRFSAALELSHFREVEAVHLHRGNHHIKRFFAAGANRLSHAFYIVRKFNHALVEAEIAYALLHFSILDHECPVASHAGENLFVRIDFADVPQPRGPNAALRAGNHLLDGLFAAAGNEYDVGRRFPHLVGNRKTVAGNSDLADLGRSFRLAHLLRCGASVHEVANHSVLHQTHTLPANAFAIERRIRLQRMRYVVHDGDIFPK